MSRYSSVGVLPRTGLALHDVPPYPIQYLSIGAALPCSALSLLVGVTAQAPPVGAPLLLLTRAVARAVSVVRAGPILLARALLHGGVPHLAWGGQINHPLDGEALGEVIPGLAAVLVLLPMSRYTSFGTA